VRCLAYIGALERLTEKYRFESRRLRWPFALYETPGIPEVFEDIVARHGRDEPLVMDRLDPAPSTAAVDVVSEQLLVYSSATHPTMPVTKVLEIAAASSCR
jgi:hypothetical protein